MLRTTWLNQWKQHWLRSQRQRRRRLVAAPRLNLEELWPRQLLSANPLLSALSVAQGDVNNDGFLDLVTADYAAGTVSVRLGQGDGMFETPVVFAVGAGPDAVVLADGNRDGRLDIIVANSLDDTVSVLLGVGDGTFLPAATLPVGSRPISLAAGDLNGDGLPDLVVANYDSGDLTVLLANRSANPTFSRIAVGQDPSAVALEDFNGDGFPDLVVTSALSRDVTVLLGRGDGTFLAMPAVHLGTAPVAVTTGDVNRDGHPDVITANQADGSVTVLLGRGDGTFRTPTLISVGDAPVSVAVGDFDADGRLDLAVANNADSVAVLLGRGDGTFQAQTSVLVGSNPLAVVAGDFNNDGRLDLATANGLGVATSVALGLGTGAFLQPGAGLPSVQAPPLVADFNGDGIPDVVSLERDGDILFRAGRVGGGTFGAPVVINPDQAWSARSLTMGAALGTTYLYAVSARNNTDALYVWVGEHFARVYTNELGTTIPTNILVGDVNGDGLNDLIVGSAATGEVFIGLQRPNEDFSDRPWDYQIDVGDGFSSMILADINGDGLPDLVLTQPTSGTVEIVLNGATAPFSSHLFVRTGDGSADAGLQVAPEAVVAGLFDGDAHLDLAVLNRGTQQVTILSGDGRGGVLNPVSSQSLLTGLDPIDLVTGDFNGDGRADLAVLNSGSADVSIFLQNDHGGFDERLSQDLEGLNNRPAAGSKPTGMSAADVNGDGHLDLLIGDAAGDVLSLLGLGDGTFKPFQRLDSHVALAVNDQNGQPQLAVTDQVSDRVTLQSANGTQTFLLNRLDGVRDPNAIKFADLNGDGIADLIVANGGGNNIIVYLGLAKDQFGLAHVYFVGTDPGGITIADLNGDGIPDLVIANQGSDDISTFFGRGQGTDWTLTAGPRLLAGAGPTSTVVQDVNRDGIVDILVANGESNTVYLLPGLGAGFFDDRHPTVFRTGNDPVQLFVGNFDSQSGLDLVTVNAGSNDLSLFPNFGPGLTIATAGQGSVQAVAGDFNDDGTLEMIVASEDGKFTMLQGGLGGLRVTNVFASGLNNVSDMGLGNANDGSMLVYVTQDGRDAIVPVNLTMGSDLLSGSEPASGLGLRNPIVNERTDPISITHATHFSTPSGAELELLAILAISITTSNGEGSEKFSAAFIASLGTSTSVVSVLDDSENAELAPAEEVIAALDPSESGDVGRNSLIAGAAKAPLLEYLNRQGKQTPRTAVQFPSPLELYDDSRIVDRQESVVIDGPNAVGAAPVMPVQTGETPANESVAETDDGSDLASPFLNPNLAGITLISASAAYVLVKCLGRRRRPDPLASDTTLQVSQGEIQRD